MLQVHAQGRETPFRKAQILDRYSKRIIENIFGVHESDTVLAVVDKGLHRIPNDAHMCILYAYDVQRVNAMLRGTASVPRRRVS